MIAKQKKYNNNQISMFKVCGTSLSTGNEI